VHDFSTSMDRNLAWCNGLHLLADTLLSSIRVRLLQESKTCLRSLHHVLDMEKSRVEFVKWISSM
jgi:hypothetical protein